MHRFSDNRRPNRRRVLAGLSTTALAAIVQSLGSSIAKRARPTLLTGFSTGFNLPGVGDVAPGLAVLPTHDVLLQMTKLGFEHVRLPIDPSFLFGSASTRYPFLSLLENNIRKLLDAGINITVDLHPNAQTDDLIRKDPVLGKELIIKAWRFLGPLTVAHPHENVTLELLNEPAFSAKPWADIRQYLIDMIREQSTDHQLFWGAAGNQTIEETLADTGPDDHNAVAAVHYYYPMIFTHQGQDWWDSPLNDIHGFPFPFSKELPAVRAIRNNVAAAKVNRAVAQIDYETARPWNAKRIESNFTELNHWSKDSGWPVIINEFGTFKNHAPAQSRANWLKAVRMASEKNGFGWCHWEFDQGFGFTGSRIETNKLDADIIDALLGGVQ